MELSQFKLEVYLGKHEFKAPYLLCCSDAETFSMKEILEMASPSEKELWDKLSLGYTEVEGLPLLREEIAKLYPGFSKENILCTSGAEEGIFCTLHYLCKPEDHVIVLTPCYQALFEICKMKGCSVTKLALKEENEWRIQIHEIKAAITPKTKCVVINFPHNPTGQIITNEELKELISLLDQHEIWLFSDEVYRFLGPKDTIWSDPAASLYKRAISIGVMSKAFGLAGLRIGWVSCQNSKVLKKIKETKHYTSICCSGPAEILAVIALLNKEKILARNNLIVQNNLKILDDFFENNSEKFTWVRPRGGCVGFVFFRGGENVEEFVKNVLEKKGVLLLPGEVYDVRHYFRIGFGRKNMSEGLAKFLEFLK